MQRSLPGPGAETQDAVRLVRKIRELGKKIANLDQVDAFLASYRQNHGGEQEGTAIN